MERKLIQWLVSITIFEAGMAKKQMIAAVGTKGAERCFSGEVMKILIKRRLKKDIYFEKRRTRRNSSLGNQSAGTSPVYGGTLFGKVSLCTFWRKIGKKLKKASLTIEAAFALPLFFFGMLSMISFMDVYMVQTEHLSKLCQNAKTAGMYAYAAGGSEVKDITLPDLYKYKPISGLIPLPAIWMHNTVKVHAWTGADRGNGGSGSAGTTEKMVYVTVSGSVYHKKLNCSHLNLSVSKAAGTDISSLRNDCGEKYHACESCSRGQKPGNTVYITKSGNRYHNSKSCSGLKRSVRLVKESDVGNLHACKRCG